MLRGAGDPIPSDARTFIERHISSVEQLELLLLLRRTARAWTPGAASRELRTAVQSAAGRLGDLERHGLVERVDGGFRYQAAPTVDSVVGDVERVYGSHRARVISLIFAQG